MGNKWHVVVDGKDEKEYDHLGGNSLAFSPDSQRVAYVAGTARRILGLIRMGTKTSVVIDGQWGNEYDYILDATSRGIVFDSPDRLHYLAIKGPSVYLVEEQIE